MTSAAKSAWKNRNLGCIGMPPATLPAPSYTHQKRGTVFVLHFDRPYQHAMHYVGWTDVPLFRRLEQLKAGHANSLLAAVVKAGIGWRLARTWEHVTRKKELSLKRSGSASRYCPMCISAKTGIPFVPLPPPVDDRSPMLKELEEATIKHLLPGVIDDICDPTITREEF